MDACSGLVFDELCQPLDRFRVLEVVNGCNSYDRDSCKFFSSDSEVGILGRTYFDVLTETW